MTDITTIPMEELLEDRAASAIDIAVCKRALALGVLEYGKGGSVQERLEGNRMIIEVIDAEIARRKNEVQGI
jgi:hypothetical protein